MSNVYFCIELMKKKGWKERWNIKKVIHIYKFSSFQGREYEISTNFIFFVNLLGILPKFNIFKICTCSGSVWALHVFGIERMKKNYWHNGWKPWNDMYFFVSVFRIQKIKCFSFLLSKTSFQYPINNNTWSCLMWIWISDAHRKLSHP